MPAPDARLPYAAAMRRYARAVAYAQLGDRAGFEAEIAAMEELDRSGAFAELVAQGVPAPDLAAMASAAARGRFAAAQKRYDEAIGFYRQAIAIESRLPYQEPPYWYAPIGQSLGAALFLARRPAEASEAFRAALAQTPRNGWVLYGLARSEAALGRKAEAQAARQAFQRAWAGRPEWLSMERL